MLYLVKVPVYQSILIEADSPEEARLNVVERGQGLLAQQNFLEIIPGSEVPQVHEARMEAPTFNLEGPGVTTEKVELPPFLRKP